MVRRYHSPSSIALGRRCARAWFHRYVDRIRGEQSKAQLFGLELHKVAEDYFGGLPVDWGAPAAKVFQGGLHLVPTPKECSVIQIEHEVGAYELPDSEGADFTRAHQCPNGILLVGKRDLVVDVNQAARARLGLESRGHVLYDWKSSADAKRYALTKDALDADLQRALYGLDVMRLTEKSLSVARWVYFDKNVHSRSTCTDSIISRSSAEAIVERAAEDARKQDGFLDVQSAPTNTAACNDYGGCEYHVSKGGPCSASRYAGARAQVRRDPKAPPRVHLPQIQETRPTMSDTKELTMREKLALRKAEAESKKSGASTPSESASPAATPGPEQPTRRPRGRPAKEAPPPVEEAPKEVELSDRVNSAIESYTARFSAARQAVVEAQAALDEAEAELIALLGGE